ncbi:hypothetical protein [Haloplanus salilacus]|uniref:hypothetical protein n=1 Tax=Haloplanus salilacus TaxID=2949994 RepID=UPI0030D24851
MAVIAEGTCPKCGDSLSNEHRYHHHCPAGGGRVTLDGDTMVCDTCDDEIDPDGQYLLECGKCNRITFDFTLTEA